MFTKKLRTAVIALAAAGALAVPASAFATNPVIWRTMQGTSGTSQPTDGASGKIGLVQAARPYPVAANSLRLPRRSLSAPEKILVMEAVASAMPSMMPTVSVDVPSTVTR